MDQISKNGITYDEVTIIFSDQIVSAANKIALTTPTDNKTELLKLFFDSREVLSGELYRIEIVDGQ